MRIVILMLMFFSAVYTSAQSKYIFHSLNYIGALSGRSNSGFQLHSVNGFQRQSWFGGVGLGLDTYYQTTIPLYASFNKFFGQQRDKFYLSAEGGTNFLIDKSTANRFNGNSNEGKFRPALYYGAHAGYKFAIIKNRGSVLFNVGYVGKQIRESLRTPLPCLVPPCAEYDQQIKYHLRRVSFRLGWEF